MAIQSIPFHENITSLFRVFSKAEMAVLFDSGKPQQDQSRYDIFSAWPSEQITIQSGFIYHRDSDKKNHLISDIKSLKHLLAKKWQSITAQNTDFELPFCGGWMGFSNYELAYELEPSLNQFRRDTLLPLFTAAYYQWAIIQDHKEQKAYLFYENEIDPKLINLIHEKLNDKKRPPPPSFKLSQPFAQKLNFSDYSNAFSKVQAYLESGDCYQVNLSMHYESQFTGESFDAFTHLRNIVPSPHMAYLNLGSQQILSISPERFISAKQSHIETKPIKGTAARNIDPVKDKIAAEELLLSEKNRAENLMIVDLLRSDFGHHCIAGTIKVDDLFTLESFSNVHHLVSTISGEIKPDNTIWDVFFSCFPGGSITGAPKVRACEIIAELEHHNREIYCGSIFYASNNGLFDSNIAIRTLLCNQLTDNIGQIHAWAGGGIVKDSCLEEEYQECQNKIGILLKSLES